jgi:hypothetical protein
VKPHSLLVVTLALAAAAQAGEIAVEGGKSPNGRYEIVLLTDRPFASDTDGAPGVVLRATTTKAVISSFVWPGDVGDPKAPAQTKAYWSPDGSHVALTIRAGRLLPSTDVYSASASGLHALSFAPLHKDIRERYFSAERPVNGGTVFERWIDVRTVEMRDTAFDLRLTYHITRDNKLEVTKVTNHE